MTEAAPALPSEPSRELSPEPSPPDRPVTRSRRGLLLAAGGAVVGAASVLPTTEAEAAAVDPALHLLRRATFGATPAALAQVKTMGIAAWLDAQLDPASVPDPTLVALRRRWPRLRLTSAQVRQSVPLGDWVVMYDLLAAHNAHAIWSQRQLYEVVVHFWTDHLVVPVPATDVWDLAHRYSYDVIRRHALGCYADLLWAAATHPALLTILDNAVSTKASPNENFGRELLELHTVGLGHYSERDVRQSALVLTGLTIDERSRRYRYDPARHHRGRVRVLGWSHANAAANGEAVAKSYLTYLARHPRTAERLARKLAVRFVADEPPATLVAKLAKVYLDHDTAIAPVLRALFTSAEFKASVGEKVKTPYEDAISTLRILAVEPERTGDAALRSLQWFLLRVGQAPMNWRAPNGYPDVAAAWSGAGVTLGRWNLHLALAGRWWLKELRFPDLRDLLPRKLPRSYGGYLDVLAARLLIGPLTDRQRATVCTFLGKKPSDPVKTTDAALRWQFYQAVALLLDTPNFVVR